MDFLRVKTLILIDLHNSLNHVLNSWNQDINE